MRGMSRLRVIPRGINMLNSQRRVLLLVPPLPKDRVLDNFVPPLALLYLAGTLRAKGDSVEIFDFNTIFPKKACPPDPEPVYISRITRIIEEQRPEVIGITCLAAIVWSATRWLAAKVKELFPDAKIVLGGMHPTLYAADIMEHCSFVDAIVLGEGEQVFSELVSFLCNPDRMSVPMDGVAIRLGDRVKILQKKLFIDHPDALPMPAYDLINFNDYALDTSGWNNPKHLPLRLAFPILTSRSCPYKCDFCCLFRTMGPQFRPRSPMQVVDEIELLVEKYGLNYFSIVDDNFTYDKQRALQICEEIIKRRLNIYYEFPNGLMTKTLDEELIDAMYASGMIRACIAIESGSAYIRNDIMRKGLSNEHVFSVIRCFRKHPEVMIHAFFIMGVPEETAATLEDTVRMLEELDVDYVYMRNCVPFPQTRLFEQCQEENLFTFDFPTKDLWDKDWFTTHLFKGVRFFIKPRAMSLDELQSYRDRFDAIVSRKRESANIKFSKLRLAQAEFMRRQATGNAGTGK